MTKSIKKRLMRVAIKSALSVSEKTILGAPAQVLLKSLSATPLTLVPFTDGAEDSFKLRDGCDFTRVPPSFDGQRPKRESCRYPDIYAHLLTNTVCSGYSSQFMKNNSLITSEARIRQRERILFSSDHIGYYDTKHAFVQKRKQYKRYSSAIFLSGDFAFNWYHFLIECLSKSVLIDELPQHYRELPIIVPPEVRKHKNFLAAFRAVLPDREFLTVGQEPVLVDNLIVIDDVSIGTGNRPAGHWPRVSDFLHHADVLRQYSNALRRSLGSHASEGQVSERLFIARPKVRRDFNQSELYEIARDYGFTSFSPERMTVQEQARAVSKATYIIGASGAAWSNLIFCENKVRGLSWLFREKSELGTFSMLAEAFGHEMDFLAVSASNGISSTGQAYNADYRLPVDEFEAAVRRLCNAV